MYCEIEGHGRPLVGELRPAFTDESCRVRLHDFAKFP